MAGSKEISNMKNSRKERFVTENWMDTVASRWRRDA